VLEIEPRALHMLDKCSTMGLLKWEYLKPEKKQDNIIIFIIFKTKHEIVDVFWKLNI
jgi:hypothetical protein